MSATLARRARIGALIAGSWLLVGTFFFSQDLTRKLYWHDPTPLWKYLVSWLVGVTLIAAMTPAILVLARRFPIERALWVRRLALHAVFSVGFAAVALIVLATAHTALGFLAAVPTHEFSTALEIVALFVSHNHLVAYWLVLGVVHAARTYQRYRDREREAARLELAASELKTRLVRSQLGVLKAQLQPHFLFNTLNAITVLVRQGRTAEADETLGQLSDLLRGVLDDVDAQEVPLHRELDHVKRYLAIEQLRFQDRLSIEIAVEPEALDAAVPHLSLQPLVENAVRHGISRTTAAGRIAVRAARRDSALEIAVTDDGPGLAAGERGHGIGLANTRARLEQLYGAAASLTVANHAPRGAIATLRLPFRVAAPQEDHADARADR
ncbi:MAG: sensor histidine kinase [Kofleriaceae bacterium]